MSTISELPREEVPGIDADTALEQLYAEHSLRLVRTAVLLVRDRALAEDVVQDCFVELYRRWVRLDRIDFNAAAYLRRSVVNRSRSALRHRAVVARHAALEQDRGRGDALKDLAPAVQRRITVLEALGRLPARQREVLVLRHYLDLPEREIADLLGISIGAVKSHTSRGSATLRTHLSDHPGLGEDR